MSRKAAAKTVKRILVVEDNEMNMKLFNDLLEVTGYEVMQSRNGYDAMEQAKKQKPDLVLMDIQLPEVTGTEVIKWFKADPDLKDIPVIAVTAHAMKEEERRIRESGCEYYMTKPISLPHFLETVAKFLKFPD
ncbi:MAG: response regulator [Dongiaceae bacterium]